MQQVTLNQLKIGIKGAGEIASAVAWRLFSANIKKIYMMELAQPLSVRRKVSFSEAVYEGRRTVEDVTAVRVFEVEEIQTVWQERKIAVIVDPKWETIRKIEPDVMVDAIVGKKNLGTQMTDAPLVIGLGAGFTAGQEVHMVVETNRGHNLGRIITNGPSDPNTGIPGTIGGQNTRRVLRAPVDGIFKTSRAIGDSVKTGDVIGTIGDVAVQAETSGILRGLIRPEIKVTGGSKLGDIDPRNQRSYCDTISDKARTIAGSVLEAILRGYNI